MHLPEIFLESIQHVKGFDRESFVAIHESANQVTSIRTNPGKSGVDLPPATIRNLVEEKVPWSRYGYYLRERPSFTFDPLFHAGCYYVQEASSMFLEQALLQTVNLDQPLHLLDLSAAPGGKSTHLLNLISPDSLLVSNEVIRSRAMVLKENLVKWSCPNVIVTNNDPQDLARLTGFFDVMVVDAPCSGSGLFRREQESIHEWSLNNVSLCCQRQQRILADAWPSLKNEGILIYSTCSYSQEEDEDIVNWLVTEFGATSIRLNIDAFPGIVESGRGDLFCYRFFPDKIRGEGFFLAVLQKKDGDHSFTKKIKANAKTVTTSESVMVSAFASTEGYEMIRHESTVYAWPVNLVAAMNQILVNMRVVYSGIQLGELMKNKMVPSHALALSHLVTKQVPVIELEEEQAIRYLQRKEIQLSNEFKGWHLVKFLGYSLGWVNVLPGRINNYYPKELRILKERFK